MGNEKSGHPLDSKEAGLEECTQGGESNASMMCRNLGASRISGNFLSFFLYIFHQATLFPAMFPVKFPIQFPIAFSPPSSPRLASLLQSKAQAECVLLSKQSGLHLHPSFSSLYSFSQQSPSQPSHSFWCNFKVRLYSHQSFCTMLARGLSRRLPTLSRLVQSSHGCSAALLDTKEDRLGDGVVAPSLTRSWQFSRGFASDALAGTASVSAVEYDFGFRQLRSPILTQSSIRGNRGFAKAVALPPQMQKPMKLRVFMGSPGVIGEPWKPLPPPLPFLKRWFTKEGWRIRKQNVQGMLKTGFTLAKIRQKTKGYSQTKFYRDASELYKEINSALAAGDRSALRQLVTDNVLTVMKKELKHREQGWARVWWELVGPLKSIRTLQGRLIGIDQKNMDTAFAQLTLRIISTQKFAAYDKQGKLVAGDPENELTVEDIWVFERQISHPEVRWKLCGRLSV